MCIHRREKLDGTSRDQRFKATVHCFGNRVSLCSLYLPYKLCSSHFDAHLPVVISLRHCLWLASFSKVTNTLVQGFCPVSSAIFLCTSTSFSCQ